MVARWSFRAVRTLRGNEISDWLRGNTRLRARVDSFLSRLRDFPVPWPATYYGPLGDGIGEIRIDMGGVEHRLYGFFGDGPDEFTVLIASSDKNKQQAFIQRAKKLKKQHDQSPFETEEYIV